MSEQAATAIRPAAAPERSTKNELRLQRKCSCGQHTPGGHECEDCKKKTKLQRWAADRLAPGALVRSYGRPSGWEAADSEGGLDLSRIRAATPTLRIPLLSQRQPRDVRTRDDSPTPEGTAAREGESAVPAPASTPGMAPEGSQASQGATPVPAPEAAPEESPGATSEPDGSPGGTSLIAADAATELQPSQLRQSDFMDQLQAAVCAETESALAGTEHSASGCPYLAYFFGYYRRQSSDDLERTLRRYVPEARGARSAADYIPYIAARVRQGVERWVRTGEVTGVPEGAPRLAAARAATAGAEAAAPATVQLKARGGSGQPADDPEAVQAALGPGRPLDSGVRSRMEGAYGRSFKGVRLHTDATASRLASEQNARAFTVGGHVAFGAGEYRPGTMIGDALIAHELAHVAQQDGSASTGEARSTQEASRLEEDADRSAATTMVALWHRVAGTSAALEEQPAPHLKSGLRLQRCSTCENQLPASETTSSNGWGTGNTATVHKWQQQLQPTSTNFKDCRVTEADPGGGADGCHFPGSTYSPFAAVTGGTWTVDANNRWGDDWVGWFAPAVTYYRAQGRAPCTTTFPQSMRIVRTGGNVEYVQHQLSATIGATTVSSSRAGQTQSRTWP